jgi:hypothetical protein
MLVSVVLRVAPSLALCLASTTGIPWRQPLSDSAAGLGLSPRSRPGESRSQRLAAADRFLTTPEHWSRIRHAIKRQFQRSIQHLHC